MKSNNKHQAPRWFNLENYRCFKNLSAKNWADQLHKRSLLANKNSVEIEEIELPGPMATAPPGTTPVGSTPALHYNIQIHLPVTKDIEVYNVIFKALFEDLMLPLVEHNFFAPKTSPGNGAHEPADDHHHESTKPDVGRWAHAPLTLASYIMKLDVALFGRVRTGPFFLLLEAV